MESTSPRRKSALQRYGAVWFMLLPIALFFGYWGHLAYKAAQKRAQNPSASAEGSPAVGIAPKPADLEAIKQGIAQRTQPLSFYQNQLWTYLDTKPGALEKAEALKLLGEVQLDLLYSTEEGPGKRGHLVESGQSLASIAQKYGSSVPAIVRANNLLGTNVQPEQHLVVPELGTLELHFYLSGHTMVVYWQGRFLKSYQMQLSSSEASAKLAGEGTVLERLALKDGAPASFGEAAYYEAQKVVKLSTPAKPEIRVNPGSSAPLPTSPTFYLASKEELEEIFPLLTTATRVIIRE